MGGGGATPSLPLPINPLSYFFNNHPSSHDLLLNTIITLQSTSIRSKDRISVSYWQSAVQVIIVQWRGGRGRGRGTLTCLRENMGCSFSLVIMGTVVEGRREDEHSPSESEPDCNTYIHILSHYNCFNLRWSGRSVIGLACIGSILSILIFSISTSQSFHCIFQSTRKKFATTKIANLKYTIYHLSL